MKAFLVEGTLGFVVRIPVVVVRIPVVVEGTLGFVARIPVVVARIPVVVARIPVVVAAGNPRLV